MRNPGPAGVPAPAAPRGVGARVRDRDGVPPGPDGPGPAQAGGRTTPAPATSAPSRAWATASSPDRPRPRGPRRPLLRSRGWTGPPSTSTTTGAAVGRHPRHVPVAAYRGRGPSPRRVRPDRAPAGRRLRRRALPATPRDPGHRPRRLGRHARGVPAAGARRPLRAGGRRAPAIRPGRSIRRRVVVDDPPPRPPAPAAAGPVGSPPGPGRRGARSSCRSSRATTRATDLPGDEVGGRFFAGWTADRLVDQVVGAGFDVEAGSLAVSGDELGLRAVRARTLADTVTEGMRLLVCGVNASLLLGRRRGRLRPTRATASGRPRWPPASSARIATRSTPSWPTASGMTDFVKRRHPNGGRGHRRRVPDGVRHGSNAWSSGCGPARSASSASRAGGPWSIAKAVAGPQPEVASGVARPTSCPRPAASTPGPRSAS